MTIGIQQQRVSLLTWKKGKPLGVGYDLDMLPDSGHYDVRSPVNGPGAGNYHVLNLVGSQTTPQTRLTSQIAVNMATGAMSIRVLNVSSWGAWGSVGGGGGGPVAAADVSIADVAGLYTATQVEAALAEVRLLVNALDAAVVLVGDWDASTGTFPGAGSSQRGYTYIVTVDGTVDGVAFNQNDRILALVDNASTTTFAANWFKLDYTDQVLSVAGKTGAVTLSAADVSDSSADGRSILTAATFAAMRALLGLVIGTDVQAFDANILKSNVNATLAAGYDTTTVDDGTKTTGVYTPVYTGGSTKRVINGGPHTLAPQTTDGTIIIQYTNNVSAGLITTSGFTRKTGDAFTLVNGDDFLCTLTRVNGFTHLHVLALQ